MYRILLTILPYTLLWYRKNTRKNSISSYNSNLSHNLIVRADWLNFRYMNLSYLRWIRLKFQILTTNFRCLKLKILWGNLLILPLCSFCKIVAIGALKLNLILNNNNRKIMMVKIITLYKIVIRKNNMILIEVVINFSSSINFWKINLVLLVLLQVVRRIFLFIRINLMRLKSI